MRPIMTRVWIVLLTVLLVTSKTLAEASSPPPLALRPAVVLALTVLLVRVTVLFSA